MPANREPRKSPRRDTHFVCLPLVTKDSIPQLAASLEHFQKVTTAPFFKKKSQDDTTQSSSQDSMHIIPEAAHRPAGTFHLTLGTMDLSEKGRMDEALQLLQEIDYCSILRDAEPLTTTRTLETPSAVLRTDDSPISSTVSTASHHLESLKRVITPPSTVPKPPLPIEISLRGLGAFNSPRNARVFFAEPHDSSGRLYAFALTVRQKFKDAGFVTETRPLVLHATVANMSYANKSKCGGRGRQVRGRDTVDASEVVNLFGDRVDGYKGDGADAMSKAEARGGVYIWAESIVVDRVAICKMGAEKCEDPVLGLVYPPLGEKVIIDCASN